MAEPVTKPLQPLTGWEKVKAGVKGFIKTSIDYLPKGILFAAIIYGGSALIGAATGYDPLLVMHSGQSLLARVATTLVIGGAISGGIGAWHSVTEASAQRDAEIQALASGKIEKSRGQAKERELTTDTFPDAFSPQRDLPIMVKTMHGIGA